MKKKSTDHTGIRNGKLFCFNCGDSYEMHLPQPVSMAVSMMNQFSKDHKNCASTWKQPVNDGAENKSEKENAQWWVDNGEHGSSSLFMFNMFVINLDDPLNPLLPLIEYHNLIMPVPADPDDFRRCHELLIAVPQWKEKLPMLKKMGSAWNNLVDHWDELTGMLLAAMATESKSAKDMYDRMQELIHKDLILASKENG